MQDAEVRVLLEQLLEVEDLELLQDAGVALTDLARPGLSGKAALLPLSARGRLRLEAAFELARRRGRENGGARRRVQAAADVAGLLSPWLRDESVEVFRVVLLDARNRVLAVPEISRGTLSTSLVHPREVFRQAILAQAAGIVVAHNHPSGLAEPSPQDNAVTERLARAGRLMGIPLLDHVIVGGGGYHSYREQGDPALEPLDDGPWQGGIP